MNFIASNTRYIRERKGYTQEYMAEELKWSRSMVMSFESGRTEPSIEKLVELSNYIKIPIDTLVKVDLRKTKDVSFIEIANNRVLFPIMVDDNNEDTIEVVPIKATAGYLSGYDDPEYIEQLDRIKLPFLPTGKHRTFPIKGDSMLPVKDGSYIVGRFVEDISDVKSGKTYIVLTNDEGIVYKRIKIDKDDHEHIILQSDNKHYPAYQVHKSDILELWEFTCCINTQEYDETELKLSSITQMFQSLGVQLESLDKMVKNA
ncbi:helix-turn-helix protein [Jejuia pallidilutea]|uniref:Helix-turn-helix protein n=1 Tax=Jejuia pallidilutea TaxID=504487 RepID=A0A362X3E1_9FLAO|nr:LexA family transcriptional regulator [Jejuia pallidilutea]PQV51224.1 helix-turn-helix protein [Jejuia pallidilutea]